MSSATGGFALALVLVGITSNTKRLARHSEIAVAGSRNRSNYYASSGQSLWSIFAATFMSLITPDSIHCPFSGPFRSGSADPQNQLYVVLPGWVTGGCLRAGNPMIR